MNNVSVIENGQQINVDLIAYFSSNNKNYLFYTKNESVQDGLVKMYVASQNMGMAESINDEEWTNLKKIMQGIIMGNSGVTFINYNNPITLNEAKAIALKDDNISSIRNAYNSAVSNNMEQAGGTNKDLLSQSFGNNNAPESEQVQISSIPNIQNNFNMESTPVNLNTTPTQEPISINDNQVGINNADMNINTLNSIPAIEPIVTPDVPQSLPDLNTPNIGAEPLTINNVKPMGVENENNNVGIDSGFKVSNEPNIFDQPIDNTPVSTDINPFNITQEEVNKPLNEADSINNDINNAPIVDLQSNVINNNGNLNTTNAKDKIELNERKIKLFEELANIYREENELLKNESDDNLEKTASDLFNNNGTLNELKVLEN